MRAGRKVSLPLVAVRWAAHAAGYRPCRVRRAGAVAALAHVHGAGCIEGAGGLPQRVYGAGKSLKPRSGIRLRGRWRQGRKRQRTRKRICPDPPGQACDLAADRPRECLRTSGPHIRSWCGKRLRNPGRDRPRSSRELLLRFLDHRRQDQRSGHQGGAVIRDSIGEVIVLDKA